MAVSSFSKSVFPTSQVRQVRGSSLKRMPGRDDAKPQRRSGSTPRGGSKSSARSRGGVNPREGTSRDGASARSTPRRANATPNRTRRSDGDLRRTEPQTEAAKRRAAVRARGGGVARDPKASVAPAPPVKSAPETWIDEGPVERDVRNRARGAIDRARAPRRLPKGAGSFLDEGTMRDVARVTDPRRTEKLVAKLAVAKVALERERYAEAKRVARSLLKELSGLAAVHEIIGLASYRLGQWRDATAALEMSRHMHEKVEHLPILADCYRAQRRWSEVDAIWTDLKQQSPAPDVMAEGRIVVAGSLADRGDIQGAIELMRKSISTPRRVREYHLRQWYVLADLYDRAGDIQRAREFFSRVAAHDPEFADVRDRLAGI